MRRGILWLLVLGIAISAAVMRPTSADGALGAWEHLAAKIATFH